MIENWQTRILGPNEIVDYSSEMIARYQRQPNGQDLIQREPMVGLRYLLEDTNAQSFPNYAQRLQQLSSILSVGQNCGKMLLGTDCIIRETELNESRFGFWLCTFPVPLSRVAERLQQVDNLLRKLHVNLGLVSTEVIDINISGRCLPMETEYRLRNVMIMEPYNSILQVPTNSPYKLGRIERISNEFMIMRTRWNWSKYRISGKVDTHTSDIVTISQLLAGMFR